MRRTNRFSALLLGVCLLAAGCESSPAPTSAAGAAATGSNSKPADPNEIAPKIVFADDVETNTETEGDAFDLAFMEHDGGKVVLTDFRGKQNILLVVTRGYSGFYCPYCSAQTARLIRNQEKFEERNTKVVVVFPGKADTATEFADRVAEVVGTATEEIPLSIVLDEDLAAVDKLMIRGDLAKPSTYILDTNGDVRFAYVGRTMSDRPSLKAILAKLDEVNGSPQ